MDAGVQDAVVVVIGVDHVEDAVVIVVRICTVRRSVVVVVGVEEVRCTVAVEVAVNDGGEGGCALCPKCPETGGAGSSTVDSVALPVDVINATGVGTVFVERPCAGCVVLQIIGRAGSSGCRHRTCDACIVGVSILNVGRSVVVVVRVKVVGDAVPIHVTRPSELVNSAVVVVVLIITAWSSAVAVFIGHAIVVVVHWILVGEVEIAHGSTGPRVNGGRVKVTVRRDVSRVQSLCFKGSEVNGTFENTVVVVIPIVSIQNTVVVVVVRVRAETSVKPLQQIVDAVVVVIKVVEVVDTVVVVVACLCLFEEG